MRNRPYFLIMMNKIIISLIVIQIFLGLFHVGTGLDTWSQTGIFDAQFFFIFILGLGTYGVYRRWIQTENSQKWITGIFDHALLAGILSWFFSIPWWPTWERTLIIFMSTVFVVRFFLGILEFNTQKNILSGNWWLSSVFWNIATIVTLINSIYMAWIIMFTHSHWYFLWLFYGINWLFLWKREKE